MSDDLIGFDEAQKARIEKVFAGRLENAAKDKRIADLESQLAARESTESDQSGDEIDVRKLSPDEYSALRKTEAGRAKLGLKPRQR